MSVIEIGIQHAYFGDAIDGKVVAARDLPNRLRRRGVVDAIGLGLVGADVRMDPRNAGLDVAADDSRARLRAIVGHRDCKTSGKRSLDDETGHDDLLSMRGSSFVAAPPVNVRSGRSSRCSSSPPSWLESFVRKSGALPMLGSGVTYF